MGKTTKDSYGPYHDHAPVAAFHSISERCFAAYHDLVDPSKDGAFGPREQIVIAMMYVAESTSYSVRLTASWAASLPAMSLCRDRYEQVVRFSYLANQGDDAEWNKFLIDYYAKRARLGRKVAASAATRKDYEALVGPMEEWETEQPTPEQRRYLERWMRLNVDTLAERRDASVKERADLPKFLRSPLRPLYESIYAQMSSVVHYDMYSLSMLGHQQAPDGQLVLAPDPWWPAILYLHCALFDIIQCADCLMRHFGLDDLATFEQLHEEWEGCCRKMGIYD